MDNINNLLDISESIDEATLALHKITTHGNDDGRMILKSDLKDTTYPLSLIRLLCNGIVLDTVEDKILSLPMSAQYSYNNINKNRFKKLYDQKLYKISKASDGSTVTLYSFDDVVCISTNGTIDCTGISIRDCPSMDKLLMEVLPEKFKQETGLQRSNGVLTWNVPEDECITLGFHHNAMHYGNQPDEVWLVGARNRKTGAIITDKYVSLLPKNIIIDKYYSFEKIQEDINMPFEEAHLSSNFGYIFESTDPKETQELSRVFMPSNYYSDIELMYMLTGMRNNKTRDDEIILRLILECNNKINNLKNVNYKLNVIVNHYEGHLQGLIESICMDFANNTCSSEFSETIINKIKREEPDVSIDSEVLKKLVSDHIYDIQNVKTFLKMFCPKIR